jgi:hypothetical protein
VPADPFHYATVQSVMIDPGKRRQVRRSTDNIIRFSVLEDSTRQTETARTIDISEGGMCFISPCYLAPGTSLTIEFDRCRILAEVKHCRLREYGADSQFVTGVQVREILDGAETWLAMTQAE